MTLAIKPDLCYTSKCLDECFTGRFVLSNAINSTQYFIVGKAPRISGLTSRHSSRQRWQANAGRFVMSRKHYTDKQILDIHSWYMDDSTRTIDLAAKRIGVSGVTLKAYFHKLGLSIKQRGGKTGIKRARRVTIYCEVCKKPFVLLESRYRSRIETNGVVRFCSFECMGIAMTIPESKTKVICKTCGKEFVKRTDHLTESNYCSRDCQSSARRNPDAKWNNPDYIKSYMKEYAEKNKDRLGAKKREYQNSHKDIKLKAQKKYRKTHKDYIAFVSRVRRQRIYSAEFNQEEWESIKAKYGFICLCCKRKEPDIKLEMDHVIPLSAGGLHCLSNIQPLCRSCNASKGTRYIDYR